MHECCFCVYLVGVQGRDEQHSGVLREQNARMCSTIEVNNVFGYFLKYDHHGSGACAGYELYTGIGKEQLEARHGEKLGMEEARKSKITA